MSDPCYPSEQEAEQLIRDNMGLAYSIAHKYQDKCSAFNMDDLIGEAIYGLCVAAKRFDKNKGKPFGAYASTTIHNTIRHAIRPYRTKKRGAGIFTMSLETDLEPDDGGEVSLIYYVPHWPDITPMYVYEFINSLSDQERHILRVLQYENGNVSKTAERFKLSRTIFRKRHMEPLRRKAAAYFGIIREKKGLKT